MEGELKNPDKRNGGTKASNDSGVHLEKADVEGIIADAVKQAIGIRAAIREPLGVAARVHVAVVDRDGDVLGVFRMGDGTNFSYDVAIQKARTAAYFSDDSHAFSTRAIGFMSQPFFPPGISSTGAGPLVNFQTQLSTNAGNFTGRLKNGITIFPGGVPLYKDGVFVGAVGVSGDGVDQDDMIAFAGASRFAPRKKIRSDELSEAGAVSFIAGKVEEIAGNFTISRGLRVFAEGRIEKGFDGIRLPYVKFPRNPVL